MDVPHPIVAYGVWLLAQGTPSPLLVTGADHVGAVTRKRFPHLALALLPICPDEPRGYMAPTHESPSQALDAFLLLGARRMVPIHFDTFVNSDDALERAPASCAARWDRVASARSRS